LPLIGAVLPGFATLLIAAAIILFVGYQVLDMTIRTLYVLAPRSADFDQSLGPLITSMAERFGFESEDVINSLIDNLGIERLFSRIMVVAMGFVSHSGMVLLFVVFLLVDQQFFSAKLRAIIADDEKRAQIEALLDRISAGIQSYLLIMAFVSGITAALSYGLMVWIGLEHAAFWAIIIFVLNFIPTLGSILGTLLPTAFALLQFQEMEPVVTLLVGIGVVQLVTGNVLLPRLTGRTLNLSMFVIMLSLVVWGSVWGVTGMLLAIPIMVIITITLSHFEATRPWALGLSKTGELS